jgi:hypothetical protein
MTEMEYSYNGNSEASSKSVPEATVTGEKDVETGSVYDEELPTRESDFKRRQVR